MRTIIQTRTGSVPALRHYLGLSQKDLARLLGIQRVRVAEVEAGSRFLTLEAREALNALLAALPLATRQALAVAPAEAPPPLPPLPPLGPGPPDPLPRPLARRRHLATQELGRVGSGADSARSPPPRQRCPPGPARGPGLSARPGPGCAVCRPGPPVGRPHRRGHPAPAAGPRRRPARRAGGPGGAPRRRRPLIPGQVLTCKQARPGRRRMERWGSRGGACPRPPLARLFERAKRGTRLVQRRGGGKPRPYSFLCAGGRQATSAQETVGAGLCSVAGAGPLRRHNPNQVRGIGGAIFSAGRSFRWLSAGAGGVFLPSLIFPYFL